MRVLSGKSAGSVEMLLKCCFTATSEASGLPFTLKRTQFPIIPAYCLSVHKAQGQSLLQLGIVFETDPFTHGQLYVALSRVGGWQHVIAFIQGDKKRCAQASVVMDRNKNLLKFDRRKQCLCTITRGPHARSR